MATHGEIRWPPVGTFDGRLRGSFPWPPSGGESGHASTPPTPVGRVWRYRGRGGHGEGKDAWPASPTSPIGSFGSEPSRVRTPCQPDRSAGATPRATSSRLRQS